MLLSHRSLCWCHNGSVYRRRPPSYTDHGANMVSARVLSGSGRHFCGFLRRYWSRWHRYGVHTLRVLLHMQVTIHHSQNGYSSPFLTWRRFGRYKQCTTTWPYKANHYSLSYYCRLYGFVFDNRNRRRSNNRSGAHQSIRGCNRRSFSLRGGRFYGLSLGYHSSTDPKRTVRLVAGNPGPN